MRRTLLVLMVVFCAPTAVMALTPARTLVGGPELGAAAPAEGNVILIAGDKSGSGPGRGGHKGAKKHEGKGGQKKGNDNKGNKKK